jgi:hypothetical protein
MEVQEVTVPYIIENQVHLVVVLSRVEYKRVRNILVTKVWIV